jgi:photosystem II stability/assembly factor-like uncharacterized protein
MIKHPTRWLGRALLCAGAISMLSLPAWSGGTDYAMMMPKASTSLLLDIASAGGRLVAVGERGHILYSQDQGESWVQATVPTSVMLTRVFFVSDSLGWAVGHDGNILVSRDGGVNWELQRDGLTDQARINAERAGRARESVDALREQLSTVAEQDKADLLLELDEAESVLDSAREAMDEPVYAPPLMDIWFADDQSGWASGGYGTLLHTSNSGRHWDDWSHKLDNPDELHLNGVMGGPGNTLFLASEWGYIFRSATGGQTWELVESGYEGSFFGLLVNPATGSVFAYGLLGTIYRSTDLGESWEELRSMARASLFGGHAAAGGTLIFVGQGGTAVRSQDDGASFTPLIQSSRRGLHGVALLGDGRYVVTGDGGSAVMADKVPSAVARQPGSSTEAEQ